MYKVKMLDMYQVHASGLRGADHLMVNILPVLLCNQVKGHENELST